jgi:hypothetical protein
MGVGNLRKKKAIENHYDPNRNGKSIAGSAQVCGTFPDFCLITPLGLIFVIVWWPNWAAALSRSCPGRI